MQLLQLLAGIFVMVTVQEYEDRMAREPVDVERNVNPMRTVSSVCRFVQIVEYLWLGRWWFPLLLILPAAVYDVSPFAVKKLDATRLWKECQALKTEGKYKLAYDVTFFFLVMGYMIYNLVFGHK